MVKLNVKLNINKCCINSYDESAIDCACSRMTQQIVRKCSADFYVRAESFINRCTHKHQPFCQKFVKR